MKVIFEKGDLEKEATFSARATDDQIVAKALKWAGWNSKEVSRENLGGHLELTNNSTEEVMFVIFDDANG